MYQALLRHATRCLGTALLLLASMSACAGDLIVSAASSLSNAFREIAPAFEAGNPGTRLLFNFAASDTLLVQISRGAPVDVYAAADEQVMDRAEELKLLQPGSRRNFVGNSMVLITPLGSKLNLTRLEDLSSNAVKHVALGRPEGVPAGRYAHAALVAAGLWQAIADKAVYAQNVRQSLDYVARGEAQAGFVYASDAALLKDKVSVAFSVATPLPINYPIAMVAGSANREAAQRFITYVASPAGQAVLARHAFMIR